MTNYIIRIAFLICIVLFSCSCSSTRTFTVYGVPGTEIKGDGISAVIQQNGETKITVNKNDYYQHFLLAKEPNSRKWIPFALDYKKHNQGGFMTFMFIDEFIGCGAMVVGTAIVCMGEPMGALVAGAGGLFCVPAVIAGIRHQGQLQNGSFDYLKHQTTNNDLIR